MLTRTVRGMVQGSSVYVVPREDGTVVVGATVEERGFDTTVTAGAVYELLRDAHRVVPGVTEMVLGREHAPACVPAPPTTPPSWDRPRSRASTAWWWRRATTARGSCSTPLTAEAVAAIVVGRRASRRDGAVRARPVRRRGGARRPLTEVPCWPRG